MDEVAYSAQKAIAYDKSCRWDAAIYFYVDAADSILELIRQEKIPASYKDKAEEYVKRAEVIRSRSASKISANIKSKQQLNLERAEFLLYQALDQDEAGNIGEAVMLYSMAIELCINTSSTSCDVEMAGKLRQLAKKALDRAEVLKAQEKLRKSPSLELPEPPVNEISGLNINVNLEQSVANPSSSETALTIKRKVEVGGNDRLTKLELTVLAATSNVNGRQYVPFLAVDLKERFAYPVPFADKHGLLALSDKQVKRLKSWMRPDEFMQSPKVIDRIDSGTIKQSIVSDCSFVASLAISARYESRFKKPLVTSIIYPQNKFGVPLYNPCGKYMIKMHFNGVWRKVVIDDRFPIGEYGDFLCSYSQQKNELWVSLLEKAYMKVMGGYDFPGSNSSIDMHALTGWIPERISIKMDWSSNDADAVFEKLFTRYHQGHCLITLATGKMDQLTINRTGLVDTHAYAVLDLRKTQGKQLLLLKNPWTHLRWKGRYSEKDKLSWTPQLCKALDYNPADAQQFDDGVFWIDFKSVCHFFDVFYVNWDPSIFPHTYGLHAMWSAGLGPVKDLYSVADNPQYVLEVNSSGSTAVWILLTRHITDKNDFANNKEYITVMVYKSGKKIYIPSDPKPIMDAVRLNSPHYLCQMKISECGCQRYTLVVAQYEKMKTIYYTLRVYSTAEFRLRKMKVPYVSKKRETGEWKGNTAGGCGNGASRETFMNNPIYELSLDDGSDDNDILVELKGPKQYSIGFEIKQFSSLRNKLFERRSSGVFRSPGYTVLALEAVPAGVYNIQPMTFLQGEEGPFFLTVEASCSFKIKRIQ
uniref:Calpain catalytic domain-containing protein n=1 Tax=Elaeophora elaphi TaxID=1147741 RepID=A0A0R3RIV2_9BILA